MTDAKTIGRRVAVTGMVVSGGLAALKITLGWLAGSTSVVADGVESAADVFTSGIVLLGLMVAARPPDKEHPYGHGRIETLAGLAVGMILAITGVCITVRSLQMLDHARAVPATFAIWPMLASIAGKTGLASLKFHYGRRIRSAALTADAWNDAVDILSGTVALAAVGLAILFPSKLAAADQYGGAIVGLFIIFLGFQVVRDTSMQLIDTMPDGEAMAEIRAAAGQVEGVLGLEKCYARKTGLKYHVDLHVEVDPEMSVRASHQIAHRVRQAVVERVDWVADVLVHVEPHAE